MTKKAYDRSRFAYPRRDVVEATRVHADTLPTYWRVVLTCGHVVERHAVWTRRTPLSVYCRACPPKVETPLAR